MSEVSYLFWFAQGMPSVSPGDVLLQPSPSRDREQGDACIAEVRTRGPGLAALLEAAITFVTRHHRARGGTKALGKLKVQAHTRQPGNLSAACSKLDSKLQAVEKQA